MGICKLDTTGSWAVDGTPIYTPSRNCQIKRSSVLGSDSAVMEDGYEFVNIVRSSVRTIEIPYDGMLESELQYMVGLMFGKVFDFTFRDCGAVETVKVRCTDCNYNYFAPDVAGEALYKGIAFTVKEL